jgi:hypothetical protein
MKTQAYTLLDQLSHKRSSLMAENATSLLYVVAASKLSASVSTRCVARSTDANCNGVTKKYSMPIELSGGRLVSIRSRS